VLHRRAVADLVVLGARAANGRALLGVEPPERIAVWSDILPISPPSASISRTGALAIRPPTGNTACGRPYRDKWKGPASCIRAERREGGLTAACPAPTTITSYFPPFQSQIR